MPSPRDPPQDQLQYAINLYMEGKLQQALIQAQQLLGSFPDSSVLYNIMGAAHVGLRESDSAIDCYKQALRINPDDAKTHYNLAIALHDKGDVDAAINSFNQALAMTPDYAMAYNGLGNALKDAGELEQAIDSYRQALAIVPEQAQVHCNLGTALKDKGDLEQAVDSYKKALQINPDYAEAYNNMGSALKDKGDMEQAISSYKQALRIDPLYTDAAWNMLGTAEDIEAAQAWVDKCLALDPNYLDAQVTRCVLEYFKGDREYFGELMQSSVHQHPIMRSLDWVSRLQTLPELYFHRWALFDGMIQQSKTDRPFYEFGVFTGESFKYLIKTFKHGYGFDTFSGLPEDWREEKAGAYSSGGTVPDIRGGEFVVGKFEDTLPLFFSRPRPMASVINFDADLYASTLCALNHARPVMDRDTILIFDEFIVNDQWEQDEFKALHEFCDSVNCTYEVLAVSFFTKQVALRLVDI